MPNRKIVVVAEDDDELRGCLMHALGSEERQLIEVEDGSELLDYLEFLAARGVQASLPDLIFTDVHMPGLTGLQAIAWARAHGVTCPFVILTAFADRALQAAAEQLGDTIVLSKPQRLEAIREAADRALGRKETDVS